MDYIIRRICGHSRFPLTARGKKLMPLSSEKSFGAGLSSILEADAKQIAKMARETFEKYVFFGVLVITLRRC